MPRVTSHDERAAHHQRILNARPIPARRLQRQDREHIPVTVRLVWERDGVQQLDTVATDWVGGDVLVRVSDDRLAVPWAWVGAGDVRRRSRVNPGAQ